MADQYKMKIIRVYGIAGQGKRKGDPVGGLTKVAVRRKVSAERKLKKDKSTVDFLIEKSGDKVTLATSLRTSIVGILKKGGIKIL